MAGATSMLASRLEQFASSRPHSSAIITTSSHYTYKTVLDQARMITRQLKGLPQSTRVLLLASEKPEDLIISFVAVNLAGLIPCFANPALDESSQSNARRTLRPEVVITDGFRVAKNSSAADLKMRVTRCPYGTNHAAYVGTSSGTTGLPKHTLASTPGMMEFVEWAMREFGFTCDDRWALVASPWTDMGLANIWLALSSGAALIPMWSPTDRAFFIRRARDFGITVCRTLPRLIDVARRDRKSGGPLMRLRILAFGGDYLTWGQVGVARKIAPQAEMINTYGTAETSGFVSYYRIPHHDEGIFPGGTVPIGSPAPHVALHAIREGRDGSQEIRFSGRNLPVGAIPFQGYDERLWDEICRGRWIRPTIRDSGDLGFCADGLWHLTGRADRQAKTSNGDWVNLDAVEKALARVTGTPCLSIAHKGSIYALVLGSNGRCPQDDSEHSVRIQSPDIDTIVQCKVIKCLQLPLSIAGKPDYERCRRIVEAAITKRIEDP